MAHLQYLRGPAGGTAGVIHTKPQQIELLLKSRWASLWIVMEVRMAFSQCQETLQSFMALLSNNDESCKEIFPNKRSSVILLSSDLHYGTNTFIEEAQTMYAN